jgi:hypothetical protein
MTGCLSVGSQLNDQLRRSGTPPFLAVRPTAASVGFCAVASHSAGIPQSRLAPPLLGVLTEAGYS